MNAPGALVRRFSLQSILASCFSKGVVLAWSFALARRDSTLGKMKRNFALSLLLPVLFSACTAVQTGSVDANHRATRYATNAAEPAPPGEGPTVDVPAEGPADLNANPAYMPSPLLRASAAGGP